MLKAIYLDMDGVLVDFVGGALRLFGVDPDKRELVDGWDRIPAMLSQELGRTVTGKELWSTIEAEGADYWHQLSWLPWGRELFALCESHASTVLMTTVTMPLGCAGRLRWINDNMPEGWQKRWSITPCKHHMAHPGAVLIDDNDVNISKFDEHGGTGFLWPASWNANRDIVDPGRVFTMRALDRVLQGMK